MKFLTSGSIEHGEVRPGHPMMVEMTTTYTRHPDGHITETVRIAGQVVYDGPARVCFADFATAEWPWEAKDGDPQYLG